MSTFEPPQVARNLLSSLVAISDDYRPYPLLKHTLLGSKLATTPNAVSQIGRFRIFKGRILFCYAINSDVL